MENGARVYIASRSEATLQRTAEKLTAAGPGKCIPLAEDLSNEAGCLRFAQRFSAMEDKLDVLVNNRWDVRERAERAIALGTYVLSAPLSPHPPHLQWGVVGRQL